MFSRHHHACGRFVAVLLMFGIASAYAQQQNPKSVLAEFDVADIKPLASVERFRLRFEGERVYLEGPLKQIIAVAFGIPASLADDAIFAPSSIDRQAFHIVGKLPAGVRATRASVPPALRALLQERLGLKTHREERPLSVYVLTAPDGTLKANKGAAADTSECVPSAASAENRMAFTCRNVTMATMAENFQRWAPLYVDRPIVDGTGLAGAWSFDISWTPFNALNDSASGITLFHALEQQLGLKLERQKRPVPVVVVDSVGQLKE